ncbi:sulfotransferase family protein [Qipengyuania sp. DGS5-3]|uniref:sulfotransferase family protein n=1 Tax=Qipengyuania sp. DGS5-3 TaxID=3349632 RepID=UPI0036D3830D
MTKTMQSKLTFIMGPPRSGTTAITRLLMSHRDVLLADAPMLGTALPDAPTYYESGIFVRDVPDEEILARFKLLDGNAPFIVEKTPSHIEQIERIRRLFPEALLIVTHREPVGCLRSWKVANRTFINSSQAFHQACKTWRSATRIAIENLRKPDVLPIDFAEFMTNPSVAGRIIFDRIGLSTDQLDHCLGAMNGAETERLKEVVGETVRGGNTRLNLAEKLQIAFFCRQTEVEWIAEYESMEGLAN